MTWFYASAQDVSGPLLLEHAQLVDNPLHCWDVMPFACAPWVFEATPKTTSSAAFGVWGHDIVLAPDPIPYALLSSWNDSQHQFAAENQVVYCTGYQTVHAVGNATVLVTDYGHVYAYEKAQVFAGGRACVECCGTTQVVAMENACIYATEQSCVTLFDDAQGVLATTVRVFQEGPLAQVHQHLPGAVRPQLRRENIAYEYTRRLCPTRRSVWDQGPLLPGNPVEHRPYAHPVARGSDSTRQHLSASTSTGRRSTADAAASLADLFSTNSEE